MWIDDPIYFVTACTHSRSRKLASDPVADILVDEWKTAATKHGWLVGRYVIMPDHVHFFCAAPPNARSLSEFVRLWKQWTTIRIVAAVGNRGATQGEGRPRLASAATARVWQREFFDHVLRSKESYAQKWLYVRDNPVRAGLVTCADDWKYQGEIHRL